MNLGKYDPYSFKEVDGNIILKQFLNKNRMLYCHFSEQDKTPNFDGYFEILEEENPFGRIEVQIKTLNNNYKNSNTKGFCSQYKYSCDTKIFNAVKKSITLNPVYLFMVDVEKNKIFAKYVSLKFVMELNIKEESSKTIYFNDTDELRDINDFYKTVKEIYSSKIKERNNGENNRFITNNNLSKQELSDLQNEFDYLNNIFDNELDFLKIKLFPNVWKFGIAYLKAENSIGIGIYHICRGKNGEYFKILNQENYHECNFVSIRFNEKDTIRNHINKFIKSLLEKAYKQNIVPLEYVSNEVLFEIIYYFLDKIASIEKSFSNIERPCTYYKDSENINIIEAYYNSLKMYEHKKHDDIFCKFYGKSEGYFLSDPIGDISHRNDLDKNREIVCELLKNPFEFNYDVSKIVLKGNFEYSIIEEAINEIKNRKIEKARRIWKAKNWLEFEKRRNIGIHRIENGFEISDYFYNLKLLITHLPVQYNSFIKKFPNLNGELELKYKYIYSFSNDENFGVKYEKYNNNSFEIEIDDSVYSARFEEISKKENILSVTNSCCTHVFDLHFPLLTHLNYLFINQLSSIYGIEKIDFENDYERII